MKLSPGNSGIQVGQTMFHMFIQQSQQQSQQQQSQQSLSLMEDDELQSDLHKHTHTRDGRRIILVTIQTK